MQRFGAYFVSLGTSVAAVLLSLPVQCQTISTVASSTSWGWVEDVTFDAEGNMYVPDAYYHYVYKVDKFGAFTTVAGDGTAGYAGDGALATSAKLNAPVSTAIDSSGNLYIAEYNGHRIRKVATNGIITTFAGTGRGGFSGDGGQATSAQIYYPLDLLADKNGNVLLVDGGNNRIRQIAPNGIITTIAGTGRRAYGGDGGPARAADMFPSAFNFGPDGSLYFTDNSFRSGGAAPRIRKIGTDGLVSTVAGNGTRGFSGDGGMATQAQFYTSDGVAVDAAGNVYFGDFSNCRIRKVGTDGIITTFAGEGVCGLAGDGGEATKARIYGPIGMTVGSDGTIYFADWGNKRIRKISVPQPPAMNSATAGVPAFLGQAGFSSNSYLEIYGTNLAQTSRKWGRADFNGANAPTTLDGVSVTVNGKPAFISYISPSQININTPDDSVTGPVLVQVQNANGFSNTGTAARTSVSPTMHTAGSFNLNGKQYAIAYTPDFQSFIGQPGMIAGLQFTPAKKGDTIVFFALGCGPTNPATQAGVMAAQNSPLTMPYEVKIGGQAATVTFAGAIAGNVGLYQFNVVIPNVQAGVQPIELTVNGVGNAQNLVITVAE